MLQEGGGGEKEEEEEKGEGEEEEELEIVEDDKISVLYIVIYIPE